MIVDHLLITIYIIHSYMDASMTIHGDVMLIQKQKTKEIFNNHNNDSDALFERKIENATAGLTMIALTGSKG
ncbi:MAG: hypothetical protein DLM72_13480 [Candidatus Nitrosopolaris wilkensis]|nr:MAG: hypothetical protein DLM72_13480 [Candidatus Nitrosopolaris wilkensis]